MATIPTIIEVTEANFDQTVMQESRQRLVLLDFWAPWCGPCKMLTPILEKLAEEFQGTFLLGKINSDEQMGLAAQFDVRGIPAGFLMKEGEVVDAFNGEQTESAIRQLLQKHLQGGPGADARLEEAKTLLAAGNQDEAERGLKRILEDDPGHVAAAQLLGQLYFKRQANGSVDATGLAGEFRQGCLLAADGKFREALAVFLKIVDADKGWNDGAARKAMLKVFDIAGARSPLAEEFRSKLARVLYR